ncbi:MAG: ABC transporter permease [Lachnospiraceae bacterium]|nr:MAG: ABC transporter permease [Lachnospiraceae bacterium]
MKNQAKTGKKILDILERHSLIFRYGFAVIMSLLVGCLLFIQQKENPFYAISVIFQGGLANKINIGTSIRWATPCMFAGAAVIIAFKSGVRNMGIEGQIYMGALAAGLVGANLSLPSLPHIMLCLLAAGIAGTCYALLPALLRLYFNVDELVVTIMMNFIARYLTYYYVYWILMKGTLSAGGSAAVKTENIQKSAQLSTLVQGSTASTAFIYALLLLILLYMIYKYTIIGYEAVQLGQNMEFSRAGGVDVIKRFLQIFLLSGFVAGLCGGMEVCGSYHYFLANFSNNIGWEAIMVANAAGYNPITLGIISCIWGVMKTGSLHLERMTSLSRYTVNIIQMLFIIFVAVDYIRLYKSFLQKRKIQQESEEKRRKGLV